MDRSLLRISVIVNNPELSDADKIEQIKTVLLEAAVTATGIIERLGLALQKKGWFVSTHPNLTSAQCPTATEPSLDGARLETKISGSRASVLAKLKTEGRRSATVAEGLFYGLTDPEELANGRIWCLDQVAVIDGREAVLVLGLGDFGRFASLIATDSVDAYDSILSFPLTEAELVARDAEAAALVA